MAMIIISQWHVFYIFFAFFNSFKHFFDIFEKPWFVPFTNFIYLNNDSHENICQQKKKFDNFIRPNYFSVIDFMIGNHSSTNKNGCIQVVLQSLKKMIVFVVAGFIESLTNVVHSKNWLVFYFDVSLWEGYTVC